MANIPTAGDFEYGPKRLILQMSSVKVSRDISQPRDMFGGPGSSTRIDPCGLVYGDEIDSIDPKDSADAGDEHAKFQAIWVRKPGCLGFDPGFWRSPNDFDPGYHAMPNSVWHSPLRVAERRRLWQTPRHAVLHWRDFSNSANTEVAGESPN